MAQEGEKMAQRWLNKAMIQALDSPLLPCLSPLMPFNILEVI